MGECKKNINVIYYLQCFFSTPSLCVSIHTWVLLGRCAVRSANLPMTKRSTNTHNRSSPLPTTPTIPAECQTPLTCSGVPESSRSLTVSGKPEDSWDLCTSEGFCAILVLPIGKVGSQPSVPTPDTIMHMKPMQANINKTCKCHCSHYVMTSIQKKKQREKLHLEPAHDITGKQIAVFGAQRVNWYSEYSCTQSQIINVILLYLWWCRRSRDSCAE